MSELRGLMDGVRKTALLAAEAVAKIYHSRNFKVESKGEAGPLTEADLLANRICHAGLMELLPDAGWLSEETIDDSSRLSKKDVWIVDPIDGTREFVEHIPQFSVSIALSRNGLPLLGAVALPAENRVIWGGRDLGIHSETYESEADGSIVKNSFRAREVRFSDRRDLPGSRILVSRSEFRHGKFKDMEKEFRIEPSGSIARKLALLAAGEADMVVSFFPKNDWDICGGTALILAAGGEVVELSGGKERRYDTPDVLSFGLAAGPAGLVSDFLDYFGRRKIIIEKKYLS